MKPRQMFVYDGEVTVTYEPVPKRGNSPMVSLTGSNGSHQFTITLHGGEPVNQLTDALLAIRADLAKRPQLTVLTDD